MSSKVLRFYSLWAFETENGFNSGLSFVCYIVFETRCWENYRFTIPFQGLLSLGIYTTSGYLILSGPASFVLFWIYLGGSFLAFSSRVDAGPYCPNYSRSSWRLGLDAYSSDFFTASPFSKAGVKAGMELHLSQGSKVISAHFLVDLGQC